MTKHHDGDLSASKVLLVLKVLVRGEKDFKSGLLGYRDQFAVLQAAPTQVRSLGNVMTFEMAGQTVRRVFIEEDAHRVD